MKWYEYILALIIPIFVLTWGNSVYLCSIFPIVGGAIGGAISALAMIFFRCRNEKGKQAYI